MSKPIDTAPADGTDFLAYWPQVQDELFVSQDLPAVLLTRWGWGDWQVVNMELRRIPRIPGYPAGHATPTHWPPLPEVPDA